MCLDSLDIISRPRPDSYPGHIADQASKHVLTLAVAHTTDTLRKQSGNQEPLLVKDKDGRPQVSLE